jgi:pimeloyl-ACP methyl ester carboxylesterase
MMSSTAILYINGRGCWDNPAHTNQEFRSALAALHHENMLGSLDDSLVSVCNLNKSQVHRTLLAVDKEEVVTKLRPFPRSILERVKTLLNSNDRLILIGHSYGGYVASRIAESLSATMDMVYLKRLHVVTFGSVYVPSLARVTGINILHYMLRNDISLRINKLKPPGDIHDEPFVMETSRSIVWVKAYEPNSRRSYKSFPFLWKLRQELTAHQAYEFLIYHVLRTKNIYLSRVVPEVAASKTRRSAAKVARTTLASLGALTSGMSAFLVSSRIKSPGDDHSRSAKLS